MPDTTGPRSLRRAWRYMRVPIGIVVVVATLRSTTAIAQVDAATDDDWHAQPAAVNEWALPLHAAYASAVLLCLPPLLAALAVAATMTSTLEEALGSAMAGAAVSAALSTGGSHSAAALSAGFIAVALLGRLAWRITDGTLLPPDADDVDSAAPTARVPSPRVVQGLVVARTEPAAGVPVAVPPRRVALYEEAAARLGYSGDSATPAVPREAEGSTSGDDSTDADTDFETPEDDATSISTGSSTDDRELPVVSPEPPSTLRTSTGDRRAAAQSAGAARRRNPQHFPTATSHLAPPGPDRGATVAPRLPMAVLVPPAEIVLPASRRWDSLAAAIAPATHYALGVLLWFAWSLAATCRSPYGMAESEDDDLACVAIGASASATATGAAQCSTVRVAMALGGTSAVLIAATLPSAMRGAVSLDDAKRCLILKPTPDEPAPFAEGTTSDVSPLHPMLSLDAPLAACALTAGLLRIAASAAAPELLSTASVFDVAVALLAGLRLVAHTCLPLTRAVARALPAEASP